MTAEDFTNKGAYFWVFTADAEKNKRGPEIKGWKKILGMKRAKPGYYAERCGAPVSYCNEGFLKKIETLFSVVFEVPFKPHCGVVQDLQCS